MELTLLARKLVERGDDEAALAVVGGEGPGVDDGLSLATQVIVAGGGEHEGELPGALGVTLDARQQVHASGTPLCGVGRVIQ